MASAALHQDRGGARWLILPVLGLALTAFLFLLLGWIIRGPEGEGLGPQRTIDAIDVARVEPPSTPPPDVAKALMQDRRRMTRFP